MPFEPRSIETLKTILENSRQPERLDDHPWARSLTAEQGAGDSPGQRLVSALVDIFTQMRPPVPPRKGKRLDTRWGEFGILAAVYFAPLRFGLPAPASLREAWGRIDQSILLFVYGKPESALSPAERQAYQLVANEPEVAPASTLSDWHRNGLQRLLETLVAREAYLARTLGREALISADGRELAGDGQPITVSRRPARRWYWAILALVLLLGLLLAGWIKARQAYAHMSRVRQDVQALQNLLAESESQMQALRAAGPALSALRRDFSVLESDVRPYLWMGRWLGWAPRYGGDLEAAEDLITLGDALLASADISYQALSPLAEEENLSGLTPARLVEHLKQVQPQLLEARQELARAQEARSRLNLERLSPQVRDLLERRVDPAIMLLNDGLTVAIELPRALGASSDGPKTYLLLAHNEDELRPNGGFITAAGTVLVQNGRLSKVTFRNSGDLDDWSKPYPVAPWPLQKYMDSPVLVFRDATWFADYPTSALYVENLYSYVSDHSVDGIIAFDQQTLVDLLRVTGPLEVAGAPYPINADNVIAYMRSAKTPTLEERQTPGWNNKAFVNDIAVALIEKIMDGSANVEELAYAVVEILNERQLLIQVDNRELASFLARRGWDGAVQPGKGDFLLVTDSNIGFNKTNAVISVSITYDVDLSDPLAPTASLTVEHRNQAIEMFTCHHWDKARLPGEEDYPINDCYWDYMRVYRPAGTTLLESEAQFIPANWMLNYRSVPPQVDILDEELKGIQVFGTLKVVPGGQSVTTSLQFSLPTSVLAFDPISQQITYHLRVQKQPGTHAIPLVVRIQLPAGAELRLMPNQATVNGNLVTYQGDLRTDRELEVVYSP